MEVNLILDRLNYNLIFRFDFFWIFRFFGCKIRKMRGYNFRLGIGIEKLV